MTFWVREGVDMVLPLAALAAWRLGAVICLFFVFALSGSTKLRLRPQFIQSVEAFTGLSTQHAIQVARWLPRLELFMGVAVLIPLFTPWVAGAICFSLIVFLLGALRAQGRALECGCFGDFVVERPGVVAWGRNLFLFLLGMSTVLMNVPLVLSYQWLLLSTLPCLLLIGFLQVEVFLVARGIS